MSPAVRERAALERLTIDTIRFLAVDAVEQAKSGHPGMPMGMADAAFVLWTRFLRYQPNDPLWPDRDRFVLSAGHGSMLLYAILHLAGYDLPLEELRRFRRLGSRTPGHPERGLTPGVETTTGPLGQGFGNGVGMAVAARMLAARVNTEDFSPVTHRVFGIVSDGDLMEGVASEAASLAGHWGLGNLVYLYDDNHITIEGDTALAFSENVGRRFEAYGWHVQHADPYDHDALTTALERAVAESTRPSLVITRSHIALGAPHKQDTREAHGEPLGAEEAAAAKRASGWPESPPFLVPDEARVVFAQRAAALAPEHDAWVRGLEQWKSRHPRRAEQWQALVEKRVPEDVIEQLIHSAPTGAAATRAHGQAVLQKAASLVPSLVGGSADLEPSTRTRIQDATSIQRAAFEGRNFHFGVREHGMASILNGIAAHGGFIPYGSSFLVFTDYARPSIRLSALMGLQVIWVFTHDSVLLGEDGPTHQPIEHLTALRAIPNLLVVRPADGPETAAAWGLALERRDGPTLLVLTRQNLPAIRRPRPLVADDMRRGGSVVREARGGDPLTVIATGSEVWVAVAAAELLEERGIGARVVSMPAPQLFLRQDARQIEEWLGPRERRVTLEAGATDYWRRLVDPRGLAIGIDRFGESAPYKELLEHFGFTPEKVAARVLEWLRRSS
ncbi:MAG: transketolase [Candidatus Eisenbacteria bacterium]|uniref:Transketolase n=1 Tax=Eiseniibacteriota bacterium TaxID=2212470 RepID=A0A538TUK4_UNCEI|nr:MAG: transketolase [Candidatus Eisenbacteria bacterium]